MNRKLQTRAFEKVAPYLQPGEQPIAAARAMVGPFGASRVGTAVAQGLLVGTGGVVGGAMGGAVVAILTESKRQFVVVTDRRLIFLRQTFMGGPGDEVIGAVTREHVSLAEAAIGVVSLLRVAFGYAGEGISLSFPLIDRKNAKALAAAMR